MKQTPPNDHFLNLTTKEGLSRSSGIILSKDALSLMKLIESNSTKDKFDAGYLFRLDEFNSEALKLELNVFLQSLWTLIDHGLVTQLFEIRYLVEAQKLILIPFAVGVADANLGLEENYKKLVKRSAANLLDFIYAEKQINKDEWRRILSTFASLEYNPNEGFGDELDELIKDGTFPFPPSTEMVFKSRNLILEELGKHPKVVIVPHFGFYCFEEKDAELFFDTAYEVYLAKVEPHLKVWNMEWREQLDKITILQSENESSAFEAKLNWVLEQKESIYTKGFSDFFQQTFRCLEVTKKVREAEKKKEVDRLLRVYTKMLDNSLDFDSQLLRINLEKEDEHSLVIIDLLRKNPEVLSAEWYDKDYKVAIFTKNDPNIIKELNRKIYQNFRFTTEYILYLKAILEKNETDLKNIFKDQDFVKSYGKNLQAVYFNYIPWYFKIFYFLHITPIVNSGYAKAKSIINFSQMDREFQYQKRRESYYKRKLKEREQKLEKENKQKQKRILVSAILEAYFDNDVFPSLEWLSQNYPIFTPEILERLVTDFAFSVTNPKKGKYSLVYGLPQTAEFDTENQRILQILQTKKTKREESFDGEFEILDQILSLFNTSV